jgi:hypothetical protein
MIRLRFAAATAIAVAGLACLAGCSGGSEPPGAAPGVQPTAPAARCVTPSPATDGLPEQEGSGSLWALYFPTVGRPPFVHAKRTAKIVWRMTGSGGLTIVADGPGGVTVRPVWGPEGHGGSTWTRPGDEWGTGWNFPTAACWTVRADRADGSSGELAILVGD